MRRSLGGLWQAQCLTTSAMAISAVDQACWGRDGRLMAEGGKCEPNARLLPAFFSAGGPFCLPGLTIASTDRRRVQRAAYTRVPTGNPARALTHRLAQSQRHL